MAVYSREILSGSTNGRPIPVVATTTPGTTIHTEGAGTTDVIYLWAINTDTTDRKLTLEWGGQTAPGDLIEVTVPAEDGLHLVVPGLPLGGGLVVTAFAASASVVNIVGYVNRIT